MSTSTETVNITETQVVTGSTKLEIVPRKEMETETLSLQQPQNSRGVTWATGTVDNEHMGKKSSKCCCIYHKPRTGTSDTSSSDSDDDDKNQYEKMKKKKPKHSDNNCDHNTANSSDKQSSNTTPT